MEPFSPPSWSLSLSPQTNTLVLMVAADSNPDDFFRARLMNREVTHSFVRFTVTLEISVPEWPLTLSILCSKTLPSSSRFFVLFFLVVRCQEGDSGQVLIFCSDAPDDAQPVDLAVYSWAATLLDCNLNVSVILQGNKLHVVSCRSEEENKISRLSPPTSVQSLRSSTVVSAGLMLIVFSSIKLFKDPPPGFFEKNASAYVSVHQTGEQWLYLKTNVCSHILTWHYDQWRHVTAVCWVHHHLQSVHQNIWKELQTNPVLEKKRARKTSH